MGKTGTCLLAPTLAPITPVLTCIAVHELKNSKVKGRFRLAEAVAPLDEHAVSATLQAIDTEPLAAAPARAHASHAARTIPGRRCPTHRLAMLDGSPGTATALAPCYQLHRMTPRSARAHCSMACVDVGVCACRKLLVGLASTCAGLEGLATHKQVSSLLLNLQALRTLHLRTTLETEVAKADAGSSHLTLWVRPPLGSALCHNTFPSGYWGLGQGSCLVLKFI
ncbi:hypothetical protein H4582DRAFT_1341712 [Lactarius indigo]|nr:hypothetical protein H4582DRAFT_1341712 [Lactarius indigo]